MEIEHNTSRDSAEAEVSDAGQNGGEAMNAYEAMTDMSPEEVAVTREQLLKYCELDTLAMVRIWQKLCESVQ